jgi:hypothetical protein
MHPSVFIFEELIENSCLTQHMAVVWCQSQKTFQKQTNKQTRIIIIIIILHFVHRKPRAPPIGRVQSDILPQGVYNLEQTRTTPQNISTGLITSRPIHKGSMPKCSHSSTESADSLLDVKDSYNTRIQQTEILDLPMQVHLDGICIFLVNGHLWWGPYERSELAAI